MYPVADRAKPGRWSAVRERRNIGNRIQQPLNLFGDLVRGRWLSALAPVDQFGEPQGWGQGAAMNPTPGMQTGSTKLAAFRKCAGHFDRDEPGAQRAESIAVSGIGWLGDHAECRGKFFAVAAMFPDLSGHDDADTESSVTVWLDPRIRRVLRMRQAQFAEFPLCVCLGVDEGPWNDACRNTMSQMAGRAT